MTERSRAAASPETDWVLEILAEIRRSATAVEASMAEIRMVAERHIEAYRAGTSFGQLSHDLQLDRPIRHGADAAIVAYRTALRDLRTAVVREFVDGQGMSLANVAAIMDVTRQQVKRLYDGRDA